MNIRFILLLIFALFCFPVFADPEYYEVTSQGTGADLDAAVKSAQKNAIEQAIGVYIRSESQVKNYMSENDEVISSSQGYIRTYEVIESNEGENGMWTVKISASVPNFDFIFSEKAKRSAIFSSILPGVGQMYKGRSVRGSVFLAAEVGLIAGIFISDRNMSDAIDDRDDPENLLVWDFYNDKVSKWKNYRTVYYLATAAVHLYNVYDAYTVTPLLNRIETAAIVTKDKVGISLIYKFQ